MKSRQRLDLQDLQAIYHTLFLCNLNKLMPPIRERRRLWKEFMDINFPELEACPCCEEGVYFTTTYDGGIFNYRVAEIECEDCNLVFKGLPEYCGKGTIVEQWNRMGEKVNRKGDKL